MKVTQLCPTLCNPMDYRVHRIIQARILEWVSCSFLQGIFWTQGSNPGLPHCRWIPYQLSHKGRPRILEWVAYPFSSRSSRPRNRTGVSCSAGRFSTNWAIREALKRIILLTQVPSLETHFGFHTIAFAKYLLSLFDCSKIGIWLVFLYHSYLE